MFSLFWVLFPTWNKFSFISVPEIFIVFIISYLVIWKKKEKKVNIDRFYIEKNYIVIHTASKMSCTSKLHAQYLGQLHCIKKVWSNYTACKRSAHLQHMQSMMHIYTMWKYPAHIQCIQNILHSNIPCTMSYIFTLQSKWLTQSYCLHRSCTSTLSAKQM